MGAKAYETRVFRCVIGKAENGIRGSSDCHMLLWLIREEPSPFSLEFTRDMCNNLLLVHFTYGLNSPMKINVVLRIVAAASC